MRFALLDLDDLVELGLRVSFTALHFAFDQFVIWRVDVLIERRRNLFHFKWREESVVDTFLKRINVYRLAEIFVGINIIVALGRCGKAKLHGRREVVENIAPIAFVVGSAAMAFV